MRSIFDLDHTVIDSSHRQLTDENGSLDLDHWRENCTRESIFKDTLLPIAGIMRRKIRKGCDVLICTARLLADSDYEFLEYHRLLIPNDRILSRGYNDNSPDAALKVRMLKEYAASKGLRWSHFAENSTIYDDNKSVRRALELHGVTSVCAIELNNNMHGSW
jgi:hypothetical protein